MRRHTGAKWVAGEVLERAPVELFRREGGSAGEDMYAAMFGSPMWKQLA